MKTFWYVVTVENPFDETDLPRVKEEICRLLDCTNITVSNGTDFKVVSRISPDQLDGRTSELARKFGAQVKAGGENRVEE